MVDVQHVAARSITPVASAQLLPRQPGRRRKTVSGRGDGQVRRFRPDIEGLRAVAVLLVVLYHSHVPGIRGGYVGVDVFFVISGFLITRQLTDELGRHGRVSLLAFYGRRAKRLLPAAALVTTATVVASACWLPFARAKGVMTDAVFAAFSGINYRLAAQGTDYLAAAAPPSPLQHYWSLAVEEQYYLVWPLLIMAAALVAPRLRHGVLSGVLLVVGAGSLLACVLLTRSSQPWAYFSLPTRAWELAVGALVALWVPALTRLARGPAVVLAWTGLAAIVVSSIGYTDGSAFPGYLALLPVAGAAAVVAAGCAGHRGAAEELLLVPPMQWIGRFSYSWYLWHWPALVLVPVAVGHDLTLAQDLGVCAASLVAAVVTYHLVEHPIRSWRPLVARPALSLGVGLSLSLVVILTATIVGESLAPAVPHGRPAQLVVAGTSPTGVAGFGAEVHATVARSVDERAAPSNLTPSVAAAVDDVPQSQRDGCHKLGFEVVKPKTPCLYGDPAGRRTVVLYGDSHAAQWLPALDALGKQQHWRIASRTKVSCPATAVEVRNTALHREYAECDQWRRAALAEIATLHPDVVLIASAVSVGADDVTDQAWSAGTAQTLARFTAMGAAVGLLADTPRTKSDGVDCLAAHLDDMSACRLPSRIAYYYPQRRAADMAAAKHAGALVVDPDPWFCADGWCPAVVGPFVVFRDSSHMTATYARWLAPALLDQLRRFPATAKALRLR